MSRMDAGSQQPTGNDETCWENLAGSWRSDAPAGQKEAGMEAEPQS